jgi:VCBS repeat-containing protein
MFDADGAGVNPAVQATLPMTFSAADLDAGKVVFKPTAHLNGAGAGSVTFRVTDNGGNSPGQATDQSANTLAINIASVNDAPSGGTPVKEFVENTTYVFDDLDFGFTDVEPNAFLAVKITTLPDAGKGTMFLNNVPVVAGAFVSVADIEAGKLTYVPVANMTGTPYASFTFQVQDNGTTANGGVDLDPTPNLFTFNVVPDEKPPVAVDDSANAVEDGSIGPGPAFNVLTNDTDANNDPLTVVSVSFGMTAGTVGQALKGKYGTLTLNADGSYTYAADQDLLDTIPTGTLGLTDVFTYEVSDSVTGSDFGTLTINVSTANDDVTTNGNGGHNTIYGDNPVPGTEDTIFGFSGNDTLYGLDGADKLYGASGDDSLYGGNGWDSLFGDTGNDFMDGGAGNDLLDGGVGIDRMFGRAGVDNLLAGGGNDIVDGGADADTLSGGSGYDVFIFLNKEHVGTQGGAHDVIGDFQVNVDKIDLSAIYGSFGSVTLTNGMNPGAFGLATFKDGGKTWVVGDVDGNGTADFGLELTGSHTLKLSDFILNQAQWNAFFTKIAQPGTDYVALHTEPMV